MRVTQDDEASTIYRQRVGGLQCEGLFDNINESNIVRGGIQAANCRHITRIGSGRAGYQRIADDRVDGQLLVTSPTDLTTFCLCGIINVEMED